MRGEIQDSMFFPFFALGFHGFTALRKHHESEEEEGLAWLELRVGSHMKQLFPLGNA